MLRKRYRQSANRNSRARTPLLWPPRWFAGNLKVSDRWYRAAFKIGKINKYKGPNQRKLNTGRRKTASGNQIALPKAGGKTFPRTPDRAATFTYFLE